MRILTIASGAEWNQTHHFKPDHTQQDNAHD